MLIFVYDANDADADDGVTTNTYTDDDDMYKVH